MAEDRLTPKQKGFVKDYLETGNGSEAARRNYDIQGDSESLAGVIAAENLKKPKIIEAIAKVLTKEEIANKHKQLLNLKTLEKAPFNHQLEDEEIKDIVESQGFKFIGTKRFMLNAVVYFAVPDGQAIKNGLDLAYKLFGTYAPTKHMGLTYSLTKEEKEHLDKLFDDAINQTEHFNE